MRKQLIAVFAIPISLSLTLATCDKKASAPKAEAVSQVETPNDVYAGGINGWGKRAT